jgi:alkylhydroperoxidase/carboxymuconolactone decarboxylase family protein YurZ
MTSTQARPKDAKQTLRGLSGHDDNLIERLLKVQSDNIAESGLDPRTHAIARIAALVALDAPPASFAWQVSLGLGSGLTPEEVVGVLVAVAPSVGIPKVVAAAPEIAFALKMNIEDES